jgi:hypothetical protein
MSCLNLNENIEPNWDAWEWSHGLGAIKDRADAFLLPSTHHSQNDGEITIRSVGAPLPQMAMDHCVE